jgi:DNA-binding response OmpR family regulator
MKKLQLFKNFTLLYVEDDTNLAKEASLVFEAIFKNYFYAKDGLKAIEIAKNNTIDIIITDIKMPKMNGLEFLKRLRNIQIDTPVILATAYDDKDLLKEALKLSVTNYIEKPYSIDELLSVLTQSLNLTKTVEISQNIYFDMKTTKLYVNSNEVILTPQEKILLTLLCKNRPNIVTYEVLEYALNDDGYTSKEALRVAMSSLRKKVGKKYIANRSKEGYYLCE